MKTRTVEINWKAFFVMTAAIFLAAALMVPGTAMAADNVGTGDIAGDGGSLNDSNTFSLFSTTMSLNKLAFLSNGTAIANSTTLPRGTEVQFVLYVDNSTNVPLYDVSVQDVLDPLFAYQANSIRVTTMASGASPAVIYSNVSAAAIVSDAVDGNVASYASTTINAGNQNAANSTLDVSSNSVWAILFRTLLQ